MMADKRKRIYYTKSQIKEGLITHGKEWMTDDNIEYIGQYHTYITGEAFTDPFYVKNKSRKLIPYVDKSKNIDGVNVGLNSEYDTISFVEVSPSNESNDNIVIPTKDDYVKGFVIRHFVYKVNDGRVIEIKSDGFNTFDKYLWEHFNLRWKIAGPLNDIKDQNGNIKESGIIDTNKRTIALMEETYKGIKNHLTDFTELAQI